MIFKLLQYLTILIYDTQVNGDSNGALVQTGMCFFHGKGIAQGAAWSSSPWQPLSCDLLQIHSSILSLWNKQTYSK